MNGFYGSAGTFYNDYMINDNNTCGAPTQILNCSGVMVIGAFNTGNGEVFAVAGTYDKGVFFATLDQNGNPISRYRWNLPVVPGGLTPKKPFIAPSLNNLGQFYICGEYNTRSYVIKVDASSAPMATPKFANFYASNDSLLARAVIESPYNANEIAVVGKWTGKVNVDITSNEAFFLALNATNGSTVTFNTSGNNWRNNRWFTSIQPANSTYGGSNGYIVGGYSDSTINLNTLNYPQWMTKLDPNGNTIWSTLIEPMYAASYNTQTTWEINDVLERYNSPSNTYEYYGIGGSTINGYDYLSVFKLADDGTPVGLTPTEFRYPGTGGYQYRASCYLTDIQNTFGLTDGLQTYAEDFSNGDLTLIKSYYNGVVGCKDTTNDIVDYHGGPDLPRTPTISVRVIGNSCPNLFTINANAVSSNTVVDCQSATVGGGSNNRLTGLDEMRNPYGLSIYPNPTGRYLYVTGNNLIGSNLVVKNNLGQIIRQEVISERNAKGNFVLDFDEYQLQPGVYFIGVSYPSGESVTTKIIHQ